jgi:hypothetical protein
MRIIYALLAAVVFVAVVLILSYVFSKPGARENEDGEL